MIDGLKRVTIHTFGSESFGENKQLLKKSLYEEGVQPPAKGFIGSVLSHPLTTGLEVATVLGSVTVATLQPIGELVCNNATAISDVAVGSWTFWGAIVVGSGAAVAYVLGVDIHHAFANPPAPKAADDSKDYTQF